MILILEEQVMRRGFWSLSFLTPATAVTVSTAAVAATVVIAGVVLAGCGQNPVSQPLSDGVMGTFVAKGDTFKVWITNAQARADVVAVWQGESDKSIPDGKLNAGPGILMYNEPWAWHIDQDDITMVSSAPEVCDGTPSEVEANLEEWVNEKGRFCPTGSVLIFLESL